ncbi:MAG: NifU family protein [Candidatus Omnitrophica bacterium]|nr:NifU family protein [Candidatus Omnitrophota bacterium]
MADLDKIKTIIDQEIRPMLNRDGGDLKIVSYADKTLTINYQGACGCCPHAAMGTLSAIQNTLREKFDPKIVVKIQG